MDISTELIEGVIIKSIQWKFLTAAYHEIFNYFILNIYYFVFYVNFIIKMTDFSHITIAIDIK